MDWTDAINKAIVYVEKNITEDISVQEVAEQVNISPFDGARLYMGGVPVQGRDARFLAGCEQKNFLGVASCA